MPAGAVIFDQTGSHLRRRTERSSTARSDRHPADGTGIPDYTGTRRSWSSGGLAAGGCIGLDAGGLTWDCYVGPGRRRHGDHHRRTSG